MLKKIALLFALVAGATAIPQQKDGPQSSSGFWYAKMDHSGDFKGKAPHAGKNYDVFKTVNIGDGSAIQDAIDSGGRYN